MHVADANAPEFVLELARMELDYLFVIGWSQLCRPPLLATARRGAIGYHPRRCRACAGVRRFPGPSSSTRRSPAATLFWIDEGVDSGPILAQRFVHVVPGETATGLYALHMGCSTSCCSRPAVARRPRPAAARAGRALSPPGRPSARPADGRIDWSRPAAEIDRLIRAVTRPYPGAFSATARAPA